MGPTAKEVDGGFGPTLCHCSTVLVKRMRPSSDVILATLSDSIGEQFLYRMHYPRNDDCPRYG